MLLVIISWFISMNGMTLMITGVQKPVHIYIQLVGAKKMGFDLLLRKVIVAVCFQIFCESGFQVTIFSVLLFVVIHSYHLLYNTSIFLIDLFL